MVLGFVATAASVALAGCQAAPVPTAGAMQPSPHRVVVIGDSLSTGFGTTARDAWPNLIDTDPAAGEGSLDVVNVAQNGSGYLRVGWNDSTFGSQVQQAVTADTDLVVFFGSENDRGFDPPRLSSAMAETYAAAREKSPHAAVLVVGPPAYSDKPEANRLAVRDAVRDAAGASGATFVDPIALGWIVNDLDGLVGPDGVHPSVAGQQDLRDKMEPLINEALPRDPAIATG
ncbi:SGNH/GDSL hydrolase family protein [Paeniglutamicibacter sp. R2-26]|uniref:SGNH/GDSL hydrolase family protein n=1 Tax=Paeniglutamicibacter sp. R2-26 TaxID=3144417 RepID=UPI003EE51AC1